MNSYVDILIEMIINEETEMFDEILSLAAKEG